MSFTFECCSANSVDGFQYPYMLITPDITGVTAKRKHQIFGLVFCVTLLLMGSFKKKNMYTVQYIAFADLQTIYLLAECVLGL